MGKKWERGPNTSEQVHQWPYLIMLSQMAPRTILFGVVQTEFRRCEDRDSAVNTVPSIDVRMRTAGRIDTSTLVLRKGQGSKLIYNHNHDYNG